MDSLEANKVIAAVLVAGIAFFLTGTIADNLIVEHRLEKTVLKIEGAPATATTSQPQKAELPPLAPLLAKANVQDGEKYTHKVCIACHTFNQGGKAGVGPNLYGVVGAKHGHMEGFNYSNAIKEKKGPWNYAELNEWLHKPSSYAPGTRMAFGGISNAQTRADVIAYLKSISPNAPPFPKPEAAKPVEKAPAPTEGGKAAPAAAPQAPKKAGLPVLLAKADVDKGSKYAHGICVACHTFDKGGKAGIGPNLYDVVGAKHGHMAGFSYSNALKSKQGPWTYAELNEWLRKPSGYAPGTKMAFGGIADPQTRADVIAFLKSISPDAPPLPKPDSAGGTAAPAPAGQKTEAAPAAQPTKQ